tara:strand:- start:1330 stop:1920 length:591 start_codon:yes stop_codon:yes gene_type:complete
MHSCDDRGKLSLNGKPIPHQRLAKLLSIDEAKLNDTINVLLEFDVASIEVASGVIFNRRMVRDEAKRLGTKEISRKRSEAGRKGGIASGKKRSKPSSKKKLNEAASSSTSSSTSTSVEGKTPIQQAKILASIYERLHVKDNPTYPLPTPYEKAMFEFRDSIANGRTRFEVLREVVLSSALGREAKSLIEFAVRNGK